MSPTSTPINLKDPANSLPGMLFIDTCIFLNALSPPNVNLPHTLDAKALLRLVRDAALQGNAFAYTSTHVIEECFFKIIQGCLIQEAKRQGVGPEKWSLVYKRRPSLINRYMLNVRAFYQRLISIPVTVVDPSDLAKPSPSSPDVVDMMQDWIARACVLPADALHLSEAERMGIYEIATFDQDFTRAQGFTIYTYCNSI